tara:strand:+ start:402 stop:728 length:327 start_codon:yes stop_codon:yes gene_type:complete
MLNSHCHSHYDPDQNFPIGLRIDGIFKKRMLPRHCPDGLMLHFANQGRHFAVHFNSDFLPTYGWSSEAICAFEVRPCSETTPDCWVNIRSIEVVNLETMESNEDTYDG